MVLRKLGLEKEEEDPIGFNTLMSTVRGQMDVARLQAQLTDALKSSGVNEPSVLRHLVDSLSEGFAADGDLRAYAESRADSGK